MKQRTNNNVNISRGLLLISFLLFGSMIQDKKKWIAPESAKKMKNPVAVDKESLAEGKMLYSKHCKSCHGIGGKGDGTKAASLDVSCGDFTSEEFKKETSGEIFWKTTEGRDPMPSFKQKLNDDERWQIVNYMRTLAEKTK